MVKTSICLCWMYDLCTGRVSQPQLNVYDIWFSNFQMNSKSLRKLTVLLMIPYAPGKEKLWVTCSNSLHYVYTLLQADVQCKMRLWHQTLTTTLSILHSQCYTKDTVTPQGLEVGFISRWMLLVGIIDLGNTGKERKKKKKLGVIYFSV